MHETTMAQNILAIVLAESKKQKARPVNIEISCGAFEAVNDEVLAFAFEALARDTLCNKAKLKIEHKPMTGNCRSCGQNFRINLSNPICPVCKKEEFDLLPDAPLILERIEFQMENVNEQKS